MRVPSLDYLRGLMALSVMLFHFEKWTSGVWNPASPIGKLGVYAVSIFFVLSGLTLTLVYQKTQLPSLQPTAIRRYFLKRLRRIFPLLWLVTAITILFDKNTWDWRSIFLNFSGLFGFFEPSGDIATGVWSIGNELVFYAFFPFCLMLSSISARWFSIIFLAGSAAVGSYHAFFLMPPNASITEHWPIYVAPMNNFFFFAAGIGLAVFREKLAFFSKKTWMLVGATSAAAFCLWPVGMNTSDLVFGWNRLLFSSLAVVFTAAVFACDVRFSGKKHLILNWLGEVSYTLYLLHPLVWRAVKKLFLKFEIENYVWVWMVAVPVTFGLSHLIFRYLEKPILAYKT